MTSAKIILLNGTSSSGKSTIARELQRVLPGYFLHVGIDQFLERVPEHFDVFSDGISPASAEGFLWVVHEGRLQETRIGPAGYRLLEGMYRSFALLSSLGIDLIVDDVIFQPEVWEMMQRILGPHDLVRVGVRCPLEVAEAREASRGDRFPGLVRAHYPFMSSITGYDFEVDSSRTTAEEAATLIRDYVLSR